MFDFLFSETYDVQEAKQFFDTNYSHIYYIFYDVFISVEGDLKQRGKQNEKSLFHYCINSLCTTWWSMGAGGEAWDGFFKLMAILLSIILPSTIRFMRVMLEVFTVVSLVRVRIPL